MGNATAEKVVLHLFHYGEIHASAIASDYGISVSQVARQLDRLERSGVAVAKQVGRSRTYRFNPRSPMADAFKKLVQVAYEGIPLEQRQLLFSKRRRPRMRGKPVISPHD